MIDNPEYHVSVHNGCSYDATIIRWTRGFSTLKKGDYFDFALDKNHAWGRGRLYRATSNFYYDDPEDEIGEIDLVEVYNPEI